MQLTKHGSQSLVVCMCKVRQVNIKSKQCLLAVAKQALYAIANSRPPAAPAQKLLLQLPPVWLLTYPRSTGAQQPPPHQAAQEGPPWTAQGTRHASNSETSAATTLTISCRECTTAGCTTSTHGQAQALEMQLAKPSIARVCSQQVGFGYMLQA